MMFFILIFELLLLFLFSKSLTSHLSLLFFKIFKSQKVSIILIAIIFLPGTIIHEISHFLVANILFVNTYGMELVPKLTGESLKLGSVQVGKTDIVRNFFIGIAPFIIGLALIFTILYYAFLNNIFGFNFFTIAVLYFLFVVSNTMFSSKKDMEGAIELLVISGIIFLLLFFFGKKVGFDFQSLNFPLLNKFFKMAFTFLIVPIVMDIVIIIFCKMVKINPAS